MGGNRVSADNPTFHELESAEMETLRHVDLLYDDIYGHYHSEENDPCAIGDGEYSKLDHFQANDPKPRIIDRSNFPHYSSLGVMINADNVCSLERPSSSNCKTTRDHQYEDIDIKQDGEGEKKNIKLEDPETLKRNYYERIPIDTSLELSVSQQALSNDSTNIDNQYGSETNNRLKQENVDNKFENPQTATKVLTKEKVGILCVQEGQLKRQQHSKLLKT